MDLKGYVPSQTTEIFAVCPSTGKDLPIKVTLYSSDSKKFKALYHQERNEAWKNGSSAVTSEETEEKAFNALCSATVLIEDVSEKDGKLRFKTKRYDGSDREAIKEIYTLLPWLYRQVDRATGNVALFLDLKPES